MVTIGTRSPVFARHGMVASSQPLATEIGLRVLKQGGNAVDAAIAVAATLNLTEPCSTGIGGDCFLLYYDAATKQVRGLNGSGRSPAALTRERALSDFAGAPKPATFIPRDHGHAVTVPGTVAGWADALDAWGTLPLAKVLEPVIALAKEGFPVSTLTAESWKRGQFQLERGPHKDELLIDGRAPRAGEIFKNPHLAACFEEIAAKGKAGFYEGRIAEAVVEMVQAKGGVMTLDDLKAHTSTFVTPIKTTFRGLDVYEIPPNGQGITALLALNILQHLLPADDADAPAHNSAAYLHVLIEAMRLAFADAKWYVSDMEHNDLPIAQLLSPEYAQARAALINKERASVDPQRGSPALSCDTVSFQVVDGAGNAVSMVNSNYEGFGTGFVPRHTGFTLQNRGSNFALQDPAHPNALAPRKRPYHTIIPAISTFADSHALHSSFTVMGGFMQPQGHVQVLCNLLVHKLNAQEAIDGARFCIDAQHEDSATSHVFIEDGVHDDVVEELRAKYGHVLVKRTGLQRSIFGRGQIILRDPHSGVLTAGSDGRADGCAMGCMAARVHELMSSSKEPEGAWQQESPASSRAEAPDNQEQQRSLPDSSSPTRRTSVAIHAPTPTPTPTRPPPLHRLSTSPMMHTSHAKILQLQEYRERVQSACQSTYQFSLQAPRKPSPDDKRRRARKGHCRSHVLASTKQFFPAREPAPSHFSAPVGHGKDRVLPRTGGAHVNFHQMTARRDEFLFGDRTGSTSRRPRVAHDGDRVMGIAKDHFALGPGQYDVAIVRPKTAAAAIKFSPSDRFHDAFSTAQLGPGQYITSDELTTPRAAAAVFSQTPRQTEAALLVSPTANTVSSYYYAPASSFPDKSDRPSCWPRSPRLSSQRRTTASLEAQKHRAESSATDFVERNRTAVEAQSTVQRMRAARVVQGRLEPGRRRGLDSDDDDDDGDAADSRPPATRFKRRSSIFYDADTAAPQSKQRHRQADIAAASTSQPLVRRPSGGSNTVSKQPLHQLESDRAARGLLTLATLSAFSVRLARTYHLVSLVRRIESTERQHMQRVVFSAWRTLDRTRSLQFATRMILANSFRYRLQMRIRRKCAHVKILRQFLGGLSIDVQFAVAMKKIKRKVQLIQRWWRHVQLMVKAREEALYHKWVSVETRLRLEHVGQMPHLQRIFQQPTTSSSGDTALHKLLNLPEQSKWFAAHFVLTSDGCLRGYSGAGGSKELVVEAKNFRCIFHEGVADALRVADGAEVSRASALSLQPHTGYSNARWKPFVMVFRPGAFRFVLLASPSPMPTEILAWKDKLERLAMAPATGGSISGSSSGGGAEGYHLRPTVGDFVEVSMQSGVLAATTNSSTHSVSALATVGEGGSSASLARNVAAAPRGKVQARVRNIRQRTRAGVAVSEGALTYYVVDLLRDFPKVPPTLVYQTIRETLREKRKSFRAAIYRYNLELFHFHRHQEQTQRLCVLDKFKEFFTLERPKRPHFRSLVSNRKMELLIRQTVEQLKAATPSNPRHLLDAAKAVAAP